MRFSYAKSYALPTSLDALRGPGLGASIHLGRDVTWAPQAQELTLDNLGVATLAYTALINEGTTEEQEALMNRELLIQLWPSLNLPIRVYQLWNERFPQLPENELSRAFA
ncbi:hypothetical protein J2S49_001137 [Arcanobacterium wilhelmae]|uniref:Transcriptional regulator n=1 Tax=Arcanobacterium wilhelmae TaxID=1803177 RepID=A0ABT9NCE4_9ACTO|nr:transcriptional regulator [Arcanobacterium wilhelmae]MDP9801061.1 hypothetical protein [Arcanobacterium wilhelmae]WFN90417.1 transcriptional regulator [Arcanobacterium wilhelmae]